jgi:hypothetical protein
MIPGSVTATAVPVASFSTPNRKRLANRSCPRFGFRHKALPLLDSGHSTGMQPRSMSELAIMRQPRIVGDDDSVYGDFI